MTAPTCPAAELAAHFDFSDPRVRAQRTEVYAELRKGPPHWTDAYGGHWVVSRYADLVELLGDPEVFCSSQGTNLPPNGFPYRFPPNEADPPQHAAYRRLAARWYSSASTARLEGAMRETARECLLRVAPTGRADLAKDLALHVPSNAIADMMGFPREDAEWFRDISDRLLETAEDPSLAEENAKIGGEFVGYLAKHLEARKTEPRDDLLTDLVNASVDGRPITPEELLGVAFFNLIAGHETTVGGITFLLLRLGQHPDVRRRITADRSLAKAAIEEALRIDSPVLHLARTVTRDTVLGGAAMKAGDKVMVLYAAGNLDEQAFPHPETFDIDRGKNRHLAFSAGIHLCQGAALGRKEMRVALDAVLDVMPDYEIVTEGVQMRSLQGVHSVKSLPVTFPPVSAEELRARWAADPATAGG